MCSARTEEPQPGTQADPVVLVEIYKLSPVLLHTSLPAVPFTLLILLLPPPPFNNPGCIFSLNQTICLLAFLSGNKDSRDPSACWVQAPSPAVPRWPKSGAWRSRVRQGPFCLKLPVQRHISMETSCGCLPTTVVCGCDSGPRGHLPVASCLLDAELTQRSRGVRLLGHPGCPGARFSSQGMY